MGRLCERPGCSETASVAYGMRAEDLVFWLDVIRPSEEITGGVLCRRHADSMIVPRNWTLDDLRDPDLHLFRPPDITRAPSARSRRANTRDSTAEQLRLGVADDIGSDSGESVADQAASPTQPEKHPVSVPAETDESPTAGDDPDLEAIEEPAATPWSPNFDAGDDLGGLLSARSPLLARAFRGDDRR